MAYFVHPNGIVEEGAEIGPGTRVWAFAHVLPGARIGAECNICDGVFIENDVTVGDRVTVKCGVQLWDGVSVGDDVFIGPNVTFTNDPYPRSKQYPEKFSNTVVHEGASIGANATILPGITIGRNALIGAGSVVTKNVPPNAVVVGNPASIIRYVDTSPVLTETSPERPEAASETALKVAGVRLYQSPVITDMRGKLNFAELGQRLPFEPKRYFMVYGVPSREIRGEHAHRTCHQLLICTNGSVNVMIDDGTHRQQVLLDRPEKALYVPAMVWASQYHYSPDAVLMVLASDVYDGGDYIREYDTFRKEKLGGQ